MKKIILAQPIINLKESSKYIKKVLEKIFQMKEMKLDYLKKKSVIF